MKCSHFLFPVVVFQFSMVNPNSSYAAEFYSPYGGYKTYKISVSPIGNQYFEINNMAPFRRTRWYVDGTLRETDKSGPLGIDPALTVNLPAGAHSVVGQVSYGDGPIVVVGSHAWYVASSLERPDLQVTSMEINDSTATNQHFLPGQTVRLDFLGANAGTVPVFYDIRMQWWYGTSAYAKTYEIGSGSMQISGGLNPGQSKWVTNAPVPVPNTPGTYWLTAKIDEGNRISEYFETNNEATLQFMVVPGLKDALDATDLEWTNGGVRPWVYQVNVSHDGIDAARSSRVSDGQGSSLITRVVGPGTLSFWWKVSSEPDDRLSLFANNSLQRRISGITTWRRVELLLPDGEQVLRWTYRKNGSLKGGQDRAWLDQVSFVPGLPVAPQLADTESTSALDGDPAATPIRLKISVTNGQVVLGWPAEESKKYHVLYTGNLSDPQWQFLTVKPLIQDGFAIATDSVRDQPQRFYRVIQDPADEREQE